MIDDKYTGSSTIMVVDDKFENVHLLDALLTEKGYRVLTFLSSKKALKSIELELPDLLLLDINMPEMDGYELASHAQLLPGGNDVPIIFISAYQNIEVKSKAFAYGGVDYITKPFQHQELLARIAVHIKLKKLQRQQHKQNDHLITTNSLLESSNMQLSRVNRQLEKANGELELLSNAKSRFLSTMSHEVRTPMSGAMGMVELLKETPLSTTQQHYVKVIQNCGDALLNVLNDILDYSKMQAGKLAVEQVDYSLVELIDDSTSLFAAKSVSTGVQLLVDVSEVSFLRVMGDSNRMRQVLVNLLSNAFKFTKHGAVSLSVAINNNRLRFEVKDSGIGISPEQVSRLFSPFSQAEDSTARRFGGTGLGLTICKELLELMEGDIGMESTPDEGSCFWFTVPLIRFNGLQAVSPEALQGKRMLLVYPDSAYRTLILRHANAWGMKVDVRPTLEGIEQEKNHYDLIMASSAVHQSLAGLLEQAHACTLNNGDADVNQAQWLLATEGHLYLEPEVLQKAGIVAVIEQPFGMGVLHDRLCSSLSGERQLKSGMSTVDYKDFSGTRVLVAEDNDVNQLVIKGVLAKFVIVPQVVINGMEVVAAYEDALDRAETIDLILMDCEMPELDGFQASEQIRMLEKQRGVDAPVPIVALSAHVLDEQLEQAQSSGMNDYLTKPMNLKRLAGILEKYLKDASHNPDDTYAASASSSLQ